MCDVGRTDQIRLVSMGVKRQLIEHPAHGLSIDTQPLRQARLADFKGAIGSSPDLPVFPLIEHQIDGIRVQGLALLRECAAPPGMQRGHQGQ